MSAEKKILDDVFMAGLDEGGIAVLEAQIRARKLELAQAGQDVETARKMKFLSQIGMEIGDAQRLAYLSGPVTLHFTEMWAELGSLLEKADSLDNDVLGKLSGRIPY